MHLPTNFADEYWKNGAAVVPDFFTAEECEELKRDMHWLVDGLDFSSHLEAFDCEHHTHTDDYFLNSSDGIGFFLEKGALDNNGKLAVDRHFAINKIGHALHAFRQPFRKATFHENAKKIMKALDFQRPVVAQSMYIFKQPRIGDSVSIHQDSTFLYVDPPSKLIAIWVALDDATCENGCLWYIPGSHKDGLRGGARYVRKLDPELGEPLNKLEFIGEWPTKVHEGEKWVPLEVKKGTAVIIHGTVVHKSESNKSQKQRPIFTWHMFDEVEDIWDKRNWLQRQRGPFWPLYETDPNSTTLPLDWKPEKN